jgi:CubicO group peptidase (beta-lactamase class C family)
VLGLVLERVAGCSYAEAIRRHVLDPCAMTGSEAVTTAAAQPRAATGHLELDGGVLVPGPLGADHCRVGRHPVHRRRPGPVPPRGGRRRPAAAGAGYPRGDAFPGHPLPEGRRYGYGLGVELDAEAGYRRGRPGQRALAGALGPGRRLGGGRPRPCPAAGGGAGPRPAELAALVGTYAAFNPWIPLVRIRPAGAGLALVWPDGDDKEPLTPLPGGGFRVGDDPASPDRVHFTAVVEGRPMRAVVSGWPYDRVD